MIKYACDVVKEIKSRGPVAVQGDCTTGEDFEEWLCNSVTHNKNRVGASDTVSKSIDKTKILY